MKAWIGAALLLGAVTAHAQQTVFMPIVIEVSGNGAVSGTNFRDGALMAIDEINAKGGILKRKINAPVSAPPCRLHAASKRRPRRRCTKGRRKCRAISF